MRRRGFTLLELVVVLVVVGILAAIAVPTYTAVQHKVADAAVLTTAQGIARNANYLADMRNHGVATEAEFNTSLSEEWLPLEYLMDMPSMTLSYTTGGYTATAQFTLDATNHYVVTQP